MSRIFISHSSANNAEAIALRDWLVAEGWSDLFLDLDPERGLKAGERWQDELKKAANRCELVIFLISPAWAKSKWCLAEFLLAKTLSKRIFGAVVEPTPFETMPIEMTAEWQIVDLTAGKRDKLFVVALPHGYNMAEVSYASVGLKRLRIGLTAAGLDARYFAWPPPNEPNRPPYRGLRPLEADDAGIFFGREAPIIEANDRLRALREAAPPRLMVILGASGAGKSSFLRAGLLPRLGRDSETFLPLPVIRPERAAISGETGLVAALADAFQATPLKVARGEIREAVSGGAATLKPLLARLQEAAQAPAIDGGAAPKLPTLIVAIDQSEELFLAEAQGEAQPFLALLRDLLVVDAPPIIAVFTIRSDNYERLQSAPELEEIHKTPLDLGPMPKGSYAEVVKGPIRRLDGTARAIRVDDALVDALLDDVESGGAKDALPLLAFTLERLYEEYGGTGHLTLDHFNTLGGIAGSIEAGVERALAAADKSSLIPRGREAKLNLLRRGLIPWLARVDPDTKTPRRRVARVSEIPAEARPMIDLLVEQRLLSTDVAKATGEITIEPAHEALLRLWVALRDWLYEDASALTSLESIQRGAREWHLNGKAADRLMHKGSPAFEQISAKPDFVGSLSPAELEYIEACKKAWDADEDMRSSLRSVEREFGSDFIVKAKEGVAARIQHANWENDPSMYRTTYVDWNALDDINLAKAEWADDRSLQGRTWHPLPAYDIPAFNLLDRLGEGQSYRFPCCDKIVKRDNNGPDQVRADGCTPIGYIPARLLEKIGINVQRDISDVLISQDAVMYKAACLVIPSLPDQLKDYQGIERELEENREKKEQSKQRRSALVWTALLLALFLASFIHWR